MAVKKTPRLANEFWPIFINQQITKTVIIQIIVIAAMAGIIVFSGAMPINSILLWVVLALALGISLLLNILNTVSVTSPLKDMLAAILNISGERTVLMPPNPNDAKYESTGLKDALQTIYELSSEKGDGGTDNMFKQTNDSRLKSMMDALNITRCGFVVLNSARKIIYANKAAPLHVDPSGQQVLDLLFNGNDDLDAWLDECQENQVRGEHIWKRVPDKLPNEENRRFFDVLVSYQKGLASETVLTLVDRTSTYQSDEEDLDFIAFAAHELRGPITVIKGYTDILQDELASTLQGDQAELFRRLAVSSNRLSGYIDNILNTSRYDRRHLKMRLTEGTVTEIYDMITDDMSLRASSQERVLTVAIPADLPTVAVDKASMSEVFGNLIDNAIKYSNQGGMINVTARVNGSFVDVSIQDNGIGMPESVVANLFQKFYRSHRSRETVAGTGIGLYISKAIVESHGGNISVRSQDGAGSTFTVSIPIYSTVADKLQTNDNSNEELISEGRGWIKNHSMYRS